MSEALEFSFSEPMLKQKESAGNTRNTSILPPISEEPLFHRKRSPFKMALRTTDQEIMPSRTIENDPTKILKMDVPRGILRMANGSRDSINFSKNIEF